LKINLKDVEIIYINLDSYVNRNQSMINMLNHCGLTASRVEGIVSADQGYDVIADAHRKALDFSSAEQVLILEDDCIPYSYRKEFDVPEDADIVYLGLHGYGHPKEKVSQEIYKVSGMAGAHAILYLTKAGKSVLLEAQKITQNELIGFDIALGKLQHKVNTYALTRPMWYQKDAMDITKFNAGDLEVLVGYHGGGNPDYKEPLEFY